MKLIVKTLPFICALLAPVIASSQTTLVSHSDTWRYHKGTNAPQANWQTVTDAALNAEWGSGPGGFGYADGDDATVLSDMEDRYTTVYIRRTFNVAAPLDPALVLRLVVDYDDAYVAYLDGSEVARSANILGGVVGVEPAFNGRASSTHEASITSANEPVTTSLGMAASLLAPGDHVLALIGLNESSGSSDLSLIADLLLVDPSVCPPNMICTDTNWIAANSPYVVTSTITIADNATLTIQPGVTVLFNQGSGLTIQGRLIAEGTETNRIVFTRNTGATSWSQLNFTANNTTSRIAHAEMRYFANSAIEANGTSLYLDSLIWTNSTAQVVDLVNSSVTLLDSFIPGGAGNEPVHFSTMPPNGHAIIKGCIFGAPQGYNDSIDFTGGNRPGPIAQFIDNIFLAAVDDCFDMDATDAHIEGNIFMNVKQDAQRDSSSTPIATGEGSGISELMICRNIFYDCEHALLLKDNGSAVMQNNTIVRLVTNALARTGNGTPIPPGIILFGEPWRGRPLGAGAIYEGNIAFDLDPIIQANPFPLYNPSSSFLVVSRSLTQGTNWPGTGNLSGDPLFVNAAGPMTAQNIRSNLMLMMGSPCIGAGPNGLDMGALVPSGASISGVPASPTTSTSATLRVAGPGVVAYRWKLNDGPWSPEIPLTNSFVITTNFFNSTNALVTLTNLSAGTNTFYAIGKNSAGAWQDTNASASKTWVIQTAAPLRIDEISISGDTVEIRFTGLAGNGYTIYRRDSLSSGSWEAFGHLDPVPVTQTVTFTDTLPPGTPMRFYQISAP